MALKRNSLSKNLAFLKTLPKFTSPLDSRTVLTDRLKETTDFGLNPGNLRMLSFIPDKRSEPAALIVVLHGCTQSAASYDAGAGWSELAERYGFVLLMPEQKAANNPNGCFNWFNVGDVARDSGEALSIRNMIQRISRDVNIDENRVFVTGLSAGGAMTSVMLATYPDVFAGGAIIAGLPYGVADNVQTALSAMHQPPSLSSRELGNLVRNASDYKGQWPKLSIWHGTADRTVNAKNANQIVKQWIDVHGLHADNSETDVVDGFPRRVWKGNDGKVLIENFTITNMTHGTPLGLGENHEHFGSEGAYLIECGISSSYHIAKFFGLTGHVYKTPSNKTNANDQKLQARRSVSPLSMDVSGVITRALTAAGLMK